MDTAGRLTTAELSRLGAAPRVNPRLFYTVLPLAMFVSVLVGFAPSYYLKTLYGTRELPLLYHVHGVAFTCWMLLMILQPALVATGRTPLHRRIGVAGGALAALMTVLAFFMTIAAPWRDGPPTTQALTFLTIPFGTVLVFPAFVGAALWWRAFPATHKRLMMIATMEMLAAGVGRWPWVGQFGPLGFFGATDLALVALLVHDRMTLKRFHPATLWGGALLIASQVARVLMSGTSTWLSFATWLTS